jgi:hypothetical protein
MHCNLSRNGAECVFFYKGSCSECPARNCVCDDIVEMSDDDRIVSIIEKWAAEHPAKTRQSKILEQWPNVRRDKNGWLDVCPGPFIGKEPCPGDCLACHKQFWSKEVE